MSNIQHVKNALQDAGLYEEGMSEDDMALIYNVIKQSKEYAQQEREYRDLILSTEQNCDDIEILNDNNDSSETEKSLEEQNNNMNPIDSTHVHNSEQVENNAELFTDKYDSSKHAVEEKNNEKYNIERKLIERKNEDIDIDVFSNTFSNYKPFSIERKMNFNSPIYCHPTFINMSIDKKAKIIFQYNMLQINALKKFQSRSINKVPWSKTIFSCESPIEKMEECKEDTGKQLMLYDSSFEKRENAEKDTNCINNVADSKEEITSDVNSRSKLRLLRPMKRKSYSETEDLEDVVIYKKTKSSNSKDGNDRENYTSKTKSNKEKLLSRGHMKTDDSHDRTNKIFDELIKQKSEENINKKTEQNFGNSSSDEEIFPVVHHLTADVHEEQHLKPTSESTVLNQPPSYRNTDSPATNETRISNIDEILPVETLCSSNKGRQTCPICQKSFSSDIIELHASLCTEFVETSNVEDRKRTSNDFSNNPV